MIDFSNIKEFSINGTDIKSIDINNVRVWEKPSANIDWFYIENIDSSPATIQIAKSNSNAPTLAVEYSTDQRTWTSAGSYSSNKLTFNIPATTKMYLRCKTNSWSKVVTSSSSTNTYYNQFTGNYNIKVGGNIMSLLYGSDFTGNETSFPDTSLTHIFYYLFKDLMRLTNAGDLKLPASRVTNFSYQYMFSGCSNMTAAPALPALTVGQYGYGRMFEGCQALTVAPDIQATTLDGANSFNNMFYNCINLERGPEIMVTDITKALNAFSTMFYACKKLNYIKVHFTNWGSSTYAPCKNWTRLMTNTNGTFVCPTGLPAYYNASGNNTTTSGYTLSGYCNAIPYGWTVQRY